MQKTASMIFILILSMIESYGQITNSTSRDRTNIYNHAIDTLISSILIKNTPAKILVESDKFILDRLLFDNYRDIKIIKIYNKRWIHKPNGTIIITIERLNINNNTIEIFASIKQKIDNNWIYWGNSSGRYTLKYVFDQEKRSYKLDYLDEWISIR